MKTELRNVYRCEFCTKYYISKYHAERHEKYCDKNPRNKHLCFDCEHLEEGYKDIASEDDELAVLVRSFWCTKREIYMHSYVAERRNHSCLQFTSRMPTICMFECPKKWSSRWIDQNKDKVESVD